MSLAVLHTVHSHWVITIALTNGTSESQQNTAL